MEHSNDTEGKQEGVADFGCRLSLTMKCCWNGTELSIKLEWNRVEHEILALEWNGIDQEIL